MRQIPGPQAAWSAGVTAKGAPSSSGTAAGAGGAPVVEAGRGARTGGGWAGAAGRFGLRAAFPDAAADLRLPRGAAFFATLDPGLSFWARRARFQTLRAAAECLRARLASRLASFRRLRARFSSSLAMRTRCLATSACSRARSRGSDGVSCSLTVFFIGGLATRKTRSLTQAGGACHRGDLSTEFVHNHVDRRGTRAQTLSPRKGLRHDERVFASDALQSMAAFSMVPVTQLRPAFLLR